jgi:hypothetical protein
MYLKINTSLAPRALHINNKKIKKYKAYLYVSLWFKLKYKPKRELKCRVKWKNENIYIREKTITTVKNNENTITIIWKKIKYLIDKIIWTTITTTTKPILKLLWL